MSGRRAIRALTAKQERFVGEYLVDCNATAAAVRAGYSSRSAGKIGPQLLGKTRIGDAIRAAMAARAERVGITQDRVLREIARIAFIDPRDVFGFGPDGVTLKDSASLSEDVAACVEAVSQTIGDEKRGGSIRVKLHDKLKALELIGRHLGMWNDKFELCAQWDTLAARLEEGRARVLDVRAGALAEEVQT